MKVKDNTKKKILIVDDDENLRTALSRAFLRRGYLVESADCADNAELITYSFSPEFALLDIRMPGRSGEELAQSLLSKFPEIKIIMLTGFGSITSAVTAMKSGVHNYLSKPVNVDEIIAAFEDAPNQIDEQSIEPSIPNLDTVEWEHIQRTLHEYQGNVSRAAAALGIHRRSLQRKLLKRKSA
ncbi:hypothetical protein BVY02_02180 [bacterium J17]|nr:hypothetical protein BVY02_02180 [bacterium J17]